MKSRSSASLWFAVPFLSLLGATLFHGGCSGCNGEDSQDGAGGAGGEGLDTGKGGTNNRFVNETPLEDENGVYQTDPDTCDKAAEVQSYVGCDFWPTVTSNGVWKSYKFAVVIANAGANEAQITVQRGGTTLKTVAVPPNELKKVFLDWVPELKVEDNNECNKLGPLTKSVQVPQGAYHVISTVPVSVYQFNPLLYQKPDATPDDAEGFDGAIGCPPGNLPCKDPSVFDDVNTDADRETIRRNGRELPCFSYSNDASLLLPSTALTGTYRITGHQAVTGSSTYIAITGTQDGTSVKVQLSKTAGLLAGGSLTKKSPGEILDFTLNAGEVAQLVGSAPADSVPTDLSGTLINATKSVQVVAGSPCLVLPTTLQTSPSCDHIEESVLPAETWGKRYFVTVPTGPKGSSGIGHIVKIYGNRDNTQLSLVYADGTTAEMSVNAGDVIELKTPGKDYLEQDFQIVSSNNQEFGVASFMLSGSVVDDGRTPHRGDPSATQFAAVAQYRKKYVFLAPSNYPNSYVDIVHPVDAKMNLDGTDVAGTTPTKIPLLKTQTTQYAVTRLPLNGIAKGGAHLLTSDQPIGLQVIGYGSYTSYQYAGGLNLGKIAAPPTILR